jgi:hypothetical protein
VPTKEGGYKVAFQLGPEDLLEDKPVEKLNNNKNDYWRRVTSKKRFARFKWGEFVIKRARYNFETKKWIAYDTSYDLGWDKENYELKIKKNIVREVEYDGW